MTKANYSILVQESAFAKTLMKMPNLIFAMMERTHYITAMHERILRRIS